MTAQKRYSSLENWLIANAGRPVYWTNLTHVCGIEQITGAMSDLTSLIASESNETIAQYFAEIRQAIKAKAMEGEGSDLICGRDFPPETD